MAEQKFLDSEVWCPLSGFKKKDGSIVPPHKIQLMICVGGGNLYARCPSHAAKVFIQDKETVRQIIEASNVIRTREKRTFEYKEVKNAAS